MIGGRVKATAAITLADGTLLIGDQAEGSVADYHQN
jgi:hypothetical protein